MGDEALPVYERLGAFYLGKTYDLEARARGDDLVLYDSRDLVTHAVCVGMTGSGKTGLCIGLLEEAAIDGVPAIIIDPKGDLANLLLTFPDLKPDDFRPWVNEDDARRKGLDVDAYATEQAAKWAKGLGEWQQDGTRIARLKNAADFRIYTPGSSAGIGVSVLRSFDAPPIEVLEDAEALRERVAGCAASLLGLAGVAGAGDASTGREHTLLCAIFNQAWGRGESLDLAAIIARVQNPGFTKLGVMELENVYPAKDRFALAMALNNLVASPTFAAWTNGEPLDIAGMLFTREGKARHAIFSIAHLGDAERMFFVSMLLNHVLAWVRGQSGTTSLRALLYMDEIAGYAPPTANPPSKWPLLTLMKQARAQGLGVVLATQNPVDLDYKGLSNAGTWFIGRLQTERDKLRVLDGLEGALGATGGAGGAGVFSREALDRAISGLQPRVFLMNNVHDDGPTVFETRWCLSYLRGPLTRPQIKALTAGRAAEAGPEAGTGEAAKGSSPAPPTPRAVASPATAPGAVVAGSRPVLPSDVPQYFLPVRGAAGQAAGAGAIGDSTAATRYRPLLLACARVGYSDARLKIAHEASVNWLVEFGSGPVVVDWDHATETNIDDGAVRREPESPAAKYLPLPAPAALGKSYASWSREFADAVVRFESLRLWKSPDLGLVSRAGESESAFRQRLALAAHEARDEAVGKLRAKYLPKLNTLRERERKAQQNLEKQREQASAARVDSTVSLGSALFGALLGRRSVGRVTSAARSGSRVSREQGDVDRAGETLDAVREQIAALQAQFDREASALVQELDPAQGRLDDVVLKPKKSAVDARCVLLVWGPTDEQDRAMW